MGYVELQVTSHFSFLRGASSPDELFAAAAHNAKSAGPMERIFASGMREYQKLRERRIGDVATLLDGTRRAMRTLIDASAEGHAEILVSAGRRGLSVSLAPRDLLAICEGIFASLITR